MENIEQLRQGLDLLEMVRNTGREPRRVGSEWRCSCPIHNGDNPTGFAIYESQGRTRWHCFTRDCGGGDEFAFLMAQGGLTFAEVIANLKGNVQAPPKPETQADILRRLQELERRQAEQDKRLSDLEKWKKSKPWEQYHDNAPEMARAEWARAGIPEQWQDFWRLGGAAEFAYTASSGQRYTTPTLTMPIYAPNYETVLTVRHRLLNPAEPGDKYRPDIAGLGSHPFLADPDLGYEGATQTIVTEGEKKAMVTFLTLDKANLQIIGIPGKGGARAVAEKLKGQDVIIILDPDASHQANQMARDIGGARVVTFHRKLDDAIIQERLDTNWMRGLIQTARFVK